MLQRTQMLQRRKRRNTIGRRSTRVRMTCRAFLLWLERQSVVIFVIVCKVQLSVLFGYLLICTVRKS